MQPGRVARILKKGGLFLKKTYFHGQFQIFFSVLKSLKLTVKIRYIADFHGQFQRWQQ
jgi:hypothetical protein